jgi:acyl-CoA-binding protein
MGLVRGVAKLKGTSSGDAMKAYVKLAERLTRE